MSWKAVWLIVGVAVVVLIVAVHVFGGNLMHDLFAPIHGAH